MAWQQLGLPVDLARRICLNWLLKIAREGSQMTPADLDKFEPARRLATLVALDPEGMATVLDELLDHIVGKVLNAAKNKHQQQFQASGMAICTCVQPRWALLPLVRDSVAVELVLVRGRRSIGGKVFPSVAAFNVFNA